MLLSRLSRVAEGHPRRGTRSALYRRERKRYELFICEQSELNFPFLKSKEKAVWGAAGVCGSPSDVGDYYFFRFVFFQAKLMLFHQAAFSKD